MPLPAAACDELREWLAGQRAYRLAQSPSWNEATTLRHYVRLATAARAKAVVGLDKVMRAALERAEENVLQNTGPAGDNVVCQASRREQ